MKQRSFIRPAIAGLSIALLSSAAYAYNAHGHKMGSSGCDKSSAGYEHGQKQRGSMMRLPSAVIEQLNLTEPQKVALFDAQTASQAMRDSMRQSMRQARQERMNATESGQFDPRQIFEQQDQRMQERQQARQQIQQQWLGFWDTLSPEQQSVIQSYMQARAKDHGAGKGGGQGDGKGQHRS
jgi:Spy/CpxP family protein refolding chaperone